MGIHLLFSFAELGSGVFSLPEVGTACPALTGFRLGHATGQVSFPLYLPGSGCGERTITGRRTVPRGGMMYF